MRIYAADDEARIRASGLVREWTRSGLIEPAQRITIDDGLRTELRRTNTVLRIVLFIFATIVLQAAVGLGLLLTGVNDEQALGGAAVVAGVAALVACELLIARFLFYRFGVEEACAMSAIALVTGGIAVSSSAGSHQFPTVMLLVIACVFGFAAYARYGYRYAALAAMVGAAAVPFNLDLSIPATRTLSALVLALVFLVARMLRSATDEEHLHDEFEVIEAAAWLGIYVVINLKVLPDFLWSPPAYPKVFFWGTYAAIWILPVIGLAIGVRGRQRWMIWANIVTALVTLSTNKIYLRWEQHTWDPILLGLLLTGTAIGLRRWLSSGPDGERAGFTPNRILSSDRASLSFVSTIAGAVQPGPTHQSTSAPDKFTPGGGSSGGGGAAGKF
jgi:hypothetical protein